MNRIIQSIWEEFLQSERPLNTESLNEFLELILENIKPNLNKKLENLQVDDPCVNPSQLLYLESDEDLLEAMKVNYKHDSKKEWYDENIFDHYLMKVFSDDFIKYIIKQFMNHINYLEEEIRNKETLHNGK